MKICINCVLPETFPGITFSGDGLCSYCARFKGKKYQKKLKDRFRQKFINIIKEIKGKGPYDVLMAYSGGKDSTYTLRLLKENFNLKILAITFDHGFISPMALENIRSVTDTLDIDHLTIKPGAKTICSVFLKSMEPDIYPLKALERASAICNSCMNMVKSFLLKTAIEKKVPIVAYGWSPGQAPIQSSVFKTNALMAKEMQKATMTPLQKISGHKLSGFFLDEYQFKLAEFFPYLVHPLAIMAYDEEKILERIKELNWKNPQDTDSNSTNCLLNSFANEIHIKQHGFHPYALEIANLVREGYMGREEGLKKISTPFDPKTVRYVKEKLKINNNL